MHRLKHVYMEELADGASGAAAGAETVVLPAADAPVDPGAPKAETPVSTGDMVSAIDEALGYKKAEPEPTPEEKAAADAKTAEAAAAKERDTKAAAGDPEAIRAKTEAENKAKIEAAKPKDLAALELTDAEKKALPAKTQQRIGDLLGIAKTERTAREAAEAKVTGLSQAREAILGVLKETNTSDQDLAQLLEYNRMVKSGQPADLERALQVMDAQRLTILKALGREGQGYDPLTEHADLAKDVQESKITRERALEIVAGRKRDSIAEAARQQGARSQQQEQQVAQARQQGLQSIDRWAADISKSDIDYKAKEATILPKIEGIVRDYPPNLWLPTIRAVYDAIVVHKQALPSTGAQPLRSSGAKPGNPAPTSMAEAISQGLGYASK